MTLKVAIQMDPIHGINPKGDSTLAIGVEAQSRGHELFYYTPDKLTYHNGKITAAGHAIALHNNPEHYYDLGDALTLDLSDMDVVLLRQDPPFNMTYLTTTYILEMLPPNVLVVNDPASVRNHPEKLFPTLLRQFMPETLISADVNEIQHFYRMHKDIIIKPLYGHGGRSILHFKMGDDNLHTVLEMHFSASKEPLMVQRFLPEVKSDDIRVILMDGKVCGALGRIPAEDEIRANMRVGGSPVKTELTKKQREVCDVLGPMLKGKGLLFAGLDMIGDYLTEVNITSPTGLKQIHQLYGTKPEADLWEAIENRCSN